MLARLRAGRENPTIDQLERVADAWGITINVSATYADGRPVVPVPPPRRGLLDIPTATRQAVLERDGACVLCGSTERLEVDHIVPRSEGGGHGLENLRALCAECHRAPPSREHGTRWMYHDQGCRCEACREWCRLDNRGRRKPRRSPAG